MNETMIMDHAPDTEAPSQFSKHLPFLQLAWDSTSLTALKKCPRYYEYVILHGYKSTEPNDHIEFGWLLHAAVELYERRRGHDIDHEQAVRDAVLWVIINTWDTETNRPWISVEPNKTRETLLRTVIWYLDHYRDSIIKTITLPNGKPAVEVSFRFSLCEDEHDSRFRSQTTGEEFLLCGHLDKVGEFHGKNWIIDLKTTGYDLDGYYFRQYTPNTQISTYDVAGAVVFGEATEGVMIDAIQVLVGGSRFKRQYISRSPEQREEYLRELQIWLNMAEMYAIDNHWPQNEQGCGYGKNRCAFWQVCASDPHTREQMLDSNFVKKPRWNPLETR